MKTTLLSVFIILFCLSTLCQAAYTRQEVITRGALRCGVATGIQGFSKVDANGRWTGFNVDICRAVAAATLGDSKLVTFVPLADNEAFTALLTGEVDLLARQSVWTFARDAGLTVNYAGVSFYDGMGMMVRSDFNAEKVSDLKKVKACQPLDTGDSALFFDYLKRQKITVKKVPYESFDLAMKGFESGSCNIISAPQSVLAGLRFGLTDEHGAVLLKETVTRQAHGPVVRQGDDEWLDIVRWTLYAMIDAEHLGVSSVNIEEKRLSNDLRTKRLLGVEGNIGKVLGLKQDWVVNVIREVGNYGELYGRNVGLGSSLKMERGMNRLWSQGGLMYAPPFQ